jgi:3'-phosphoadenosine 5'-phosphosulfate (PAPS) 3'-phosphatase
MLQQGWSCIPMLCRSCGPLNAKYLRPHLQVKYFAVARGDVAGFIQFQTKLKSWDHAPGVLCVQESGGSALDANGDEVLFTDREFSVAKGIICIAAEADTMTRQRLTACVQQTDMGE